MQPPPRKGGYLKVLKHLHSEQLAKLNSKNQQECDLLEDIRSFTKQRSAIERSYGDALLKLASGYQNRKIACVPDIRLEDGSEAWNVFSVWRTVLDETEKLGKCRLAGVEVFQQHISEDAKQTRHNKTMLGKRFTEQLSVCQKELQAQVQELDRLKKIYNDDESVAIDAREKASAAEEKLKRKKGSIFQSITSLQKNSAKFANKRDMCDEKSHGARNDYILALTSTNAHQRRYYEIDFERLLRTLECEMYDKVAEYLTLLGRTELLTCSASQVSYTKIRDQAQTITRGYNLRCYLTYYPMLGQNVQYDFDPSNEDIIGKITIIDDLHKEQLEAEARKNVLKISKEIKVVRDCCRRIQKIQINAKPDEGTSISEPEPRIEELKQLIRKAETEKMKAEAKFEVLKEGGVEVDEYCKSVDSDSLAVDLDATLSRSGSSLSVREDADAAAAAVAAAEHGEGGAGDAGGRVHEASETAQLQRQATDASTHQNEAVEAQEASFATWDPVDPVKVDWGDEDQPAEAAAPAEGDDMYDQSIDSPRVDDATQGAQQATGTKCVALYTYTGQNPDELTFQEGEELELIGEGDGDGWISAKNYKGEVGFIPQNYIEVEEGSVLPPPPPETEPVPAAQPASFTTVDYNIQTKTDNNFQQQQQEQQQQQQQQQKQQSVDVPPASFDEDEDFGDPPAEAPPSMPPPPPPTSIAITNGTTKPAAPPKLDLPAQDGSHGLAEYCVALYDYEETCHEELTFEEGELIKIIARSVHDVDDGWWMGEMSNGQQGLFPSLVVEECGSNGEPLTPDALSGGSPGTTPPPHTPPEVPGFLLPPEGIIITQPTPEVETAEEAVKIREEAAAAAAAADSATTQDNDAKTTHKKGEKTDQYQRQFSSSPDSESNAAGLQNDKDHYAELVSSPDASTQDASDTLKDCELSDDTPTENAVEELEADDGRKGGHPPPPGHKKPPRPSTQKSASETDADDGLDATEIIVTAATPMVDAAQPTEGEANEQDKVARGSSDPDQDGNHSDVEGEAVLLDDEDHPPPPPPAPSGGGGSGVEERRREEEEEESNLTRGSSIESSEKKAGANGVGGSRNIVKGAASIELSTSDNNGAKSPTPSDGPPDLDLEKLKALDKLKESDA